MFVFFVCFCLFVDLHSFVQEYSAHTEASPLSVESKLNLCPFSAPTAFFKGGISIVPLLLYYEISVFAISSELQRQWCHLYDKPRVLGTSSNPTGVVLVTHSRCSFQITCPGDC